MSEVLVVAEHRDGEIRDVTGEAINAASELGSGRVSVALIAPNPRDLVHGIDGESVETIYTIEFDEPFNHDVYYAAVRTVAEEVSPRVLLAANTVNGMDFLPAVAGALEWPLVTDAIELERDGRMLTVVREAFGSKVETTVRISELPAVVSIRPGEWAAETAGGSPSVESVPTPLDEEEIRTHVTGFEAVAAGDIDISEAEVLVSVGRGIGEEDNLELIEELAEVLDATIAASRPIVDAGWLPKNRQVGQSGKTVTPSIYLAIGISGAVQHIAGMKGAEHIVAINKDPDAPIFDIADVGIVDDLFDVVPALIEAFGD